MNLPERTSSAHTIKRPTGRPPSRALPPKIYPKKNGYEPFKTASGTILIPNPVPPGTKDAPDNIREIIHCGCEVSECLGDRCKCKSIGCTTFCKCEAGLNCKNPLTKRVTGVDEEDEDIDLETLTDQTLTGSIISMLMPCTVTLALVYVDQFDIFCLNQFVY